MLETQSINLQNELHAKYAVEISEQQASAKQALDTAESAANNELLAVSQQLEMTKNDILTGKQKIKQADELHKEAVKKLISQSEERLIEQKKSAQANLESAVALARQQGEIMGAEDFQKQLKSEQLLEKMNGEEAHLAQQEQAEVRQQTQVRVEKDYVCLFVTKSNVVTKTFWSNDCSAVVVLVVT